MKLKRTSLTKLYISWAKGNAERLATLKAKRDELLQEILNNGGNAVLSGSLGDSSFTYSLTDSYSAGELCAIIEAAIDNLENNTPLFKSSVNVTFRR